MTQTTTVRSSVPAPPARPRLAQVQALRALAVLGVVFFHLWPNYIPGGFVGVDVFFVISGFLISGQILRALNAGTFSLGQFYARRFRRLMPAATVVILASLVGTVAVLPYSLWRGSFTEGLASATYVQNWVLAAGSDYFEDMGTAFQHYWSLSVEEQFYLFWPWLLIGLTALAVRRHLGRKAVAAGMAVVTAVSFGASVVLTAVDESTAYFATHTRAWEFGVGALLVLLPRPRLSDRSAAALSWVSLATIAATMVVYAEATPFPSWTAAVPVLATAGAITAGMPRARWSPSALLGLRPVQYVGNVSYSFYLWHWPPIVFIEHLRADSSGLAHQSGMMAKLAILVATFAAAAWTKRHVEDRFRVPPRAPDGARGPVRVRTAHVLVVVVLPAVTVVWALGGVLQLNRSAERQTVLAQQAEQEHLACFGAAALADPGCSPPFGREMTPDLASAKVEYRDSRVYRECFISDKHTESLAKCEFGPGQADTTVALIGDSHALSWLPAVEKLTSERGWRMVTYLRGSCPVNVATIVRADPVEVELCRQWTGRVVDEIVHDAAVDLVVTTANDNKEWASRSGLTSFETGVAGYREAWTRFTDAGKRVLVLEDTPRPRPSVLECLSVRADFGTCGIGPADAEELGDAPTSADSSLITAVQSLASPSVMLADPTSQICRPSRCDAVLGNVVVYVDGSHLSPMFARSLTPWLAAEVDRSLGGA